MDIRLSPSYTYDVAISYSREDRAVVDRLVAYLRARGIRPYLDTLEEVAAATWNEELLPELRRIYGHEAAFAVFFISESWKRSLFTRVELAAAMERMLAQEDYVRVVRLDDAEIEGLPESRVFLDARPGARHADPDQLCRTVFRALVTSSERASDRDEFEEIDRFVEHLRREERRKLDAERERIRGERGEGPTPAAYFDVILPRMLRWRGQAAAAVGATVRFVVTGRGGGTWTLRLKPPVAAVIRDRAFHARPDLTIKLGAPQMMDMLRGTFDARQELIEGNVELQGDFTILRRLEGLFVSSQAELEGEPAESDRPGTDRAAGPGDG